MVGVISGILNATLPGCAFVGDSTSDVFAGRLAGMPAWEMMQVLAAKSMFSCTGPAGHCS